jgi:hypothetical protein
MTVTKAIVNGPDATQTFTLPYYTGIAPASLEIKGANQRVATFIKADANPANTKEFTLTRTETPKSNSGAGALNLAMVNNSKEVWTDSSVGEIGRHGLKVSISVDVVGSYVGTPQDVIDEIFATANLFHQERAADDVPGTDNLVDWSNKLLTLE